MQGKRLPLESQTGSRIIIPQCNRFNNFISALLKKDKNYLLNLKISRDFVPTVLECMHSLMEIHSYIFTNSTDLTRMRSCGSSKNA